jgi:hypothetical protein
MAQTIDEQERQREHELALAELRRGGGCWQAGPD